MYNLITLTGLAKHYDGFDLVDVDLEVPRGMVVGLIGSNGAGKTTMLKSILGLALPDHGTVDLLGERIFDSAQTPALHDKRLSQLKQRIGVVFDACAFPEEIKIKEVSLMMRNSYDHWDEAQYQAYLKEFNLDESKQIKDLSRGMGMKLTLACALSHNADLLVLDEATAGLDPIARDELLDVFHKFMEDEHHAILMSSHITSDLEKIADYIVCIDNGRIIFKVEKDVIVGEAGIARCRVAQFEQLVADGFFAPGTLRYQKNEFGVTVLTPNRFEFQEAYGDVVVETASIDDYMNLMLKGVQQ